MFIPSVKLIAWTQLRRADADTLAQEAAQVLESAALDEIKEAWLKGDVAPNRGISIQITPHPESSWGERVTQEQIDQMLIDRDLQKLATEDASESADLPVSLVAEQPKQEEAGQAPNLGEIPKFFEGPRKLIHSQNLGKALKKYAEARGLMLDALIKEMGWPKGTSSLRSILNKKGSVDTKYADYFVSLLGAGVMG
jgi:hypothetical protein